MNTMNLLQTGVLQAQRLARGTIDAVVGGERVIVRVGGDDNDVCWCDVLTTATAPLDFAPGDEVLIWHPGRNEERAVILGRLGARRSAPSEPEPAAPDELIIEAKKSLVLRVGNGSITIREDGKILIKGKDLVSHAQRTNRIKGGSVAIN
jgi:hypothetical protein